MDGEECYVNSQYARLLWLCRLAGVAPAHLTRCGRGYKLTLSRKFAIYSYIINIFLLIYFLYGSFFIIRLKILNELTHINDIFLLSTLTLSDYLTKNFCMVLLTYKCSQRFKRIITYLNKIDKIHAALDSNYVDIRLKRSAVVAWLVSILLLFIYKGWILVKEVVIYGETIHKLGYIITLLVRHSIITYVYNTEMCYIYVLCLLKSTINMFNRRLRYFIIEDTSKFRTKALLRKQTHHLFRVYVSLCDLVVEFNNEEGTIITSFILFHVFDISIMNILRYHHFTTSSDTMLSICVRFLQIAYRCYRFVIFIEACHRVNGREIQKLVSELLSTFRGAQAQLYCFQLNFMLYEIEIVPCGLFRITRAVIPFAFGVVSTIATVVASVPLLYD